MSVPRYERYKESGVEWLGEVPEHWNTMRLRVLVEIKKRIVGELGHDILSITQQGIRVKDTENNEGQLALDYSKYQRVEPGDFAMNHMDLLTGFVDIASMNGVTSPDYRVFSVRPGIVCSKRYLLYVFQNAYRRKIFYAFGQGSSHLGRWRLPTEQFNDFVVPFPLRDEQEQIAIFLDQETAKLNALIEQQRRLVGLLKEKRQAVISRAVTRGLDPSAPMKDSDVQWVGELPTHWDAVPLKHLIAEPLMYGANESAEEENPSDPRYVRITDIDSDGSLRDETFRSLPLDIASQHLLEEGDLLLARSGGTVGKSFIYRKEWGRCCFAGYLIKARMRSLNEASFVYLFSQSSGYWSFVASEQIQSTIQNLSAERYGNLVIPWPPIEEQSAICSYLFSRNRRFDELIATAERAIEFLNERRSALISAAVTGKINVTVQVAKPVRSTWNTGFARQVLAAETLSRCNGIRMGRIKLQKLIHLCEYHAQLDELGSTYSRKAAGPFDAQAMAGVRKGLLQQRWFEEFKDGSRYAYRPLEKVGGHKQYLPHWKDKQARIDQVLNLLGDARTRTCEIASTLYAAWNDLLIEGKSPTDAEIIHEASSAERWHESKEKIAADKWPKALEWMRAKGLVPIGYGTHTKHRSDQGSEEPHEPT